MDEDWLEQCFFALGPVRIKRMFGVQGIWVDGVICALVVDGELLLKADAQTAPRFVEAGAAQWTYEREGRKPVAMPYWSVPDGVKDDPTSLAVWTRLTFEAGLRAEHGKTARKRKS